jgi:hypothetical protein
MPAEAKGTSAKAAKAFVRYYFDALNHATATGDTRPIEQLAGKSCMSCRNFEKKISAIYAADGHISSGGWEVRSITPVAHQSARRPILQLGMFLNPETVVANSGAHARKFKGGKQPMTMFLRRKDDSWQVSRLDLVV